MNSKFTCSMRVCMCLHVLISFDFFYVKLNRFSVVVVVFNTQLNLMSYFSEMHCALFKCS